MGALYKSAEVNMCQAAKLSNAAQVGGGVPIVISNQSTNKQPEGVTIHTRTCSVPFKKIDIFNFMEGQILPPSSQNLVSIGIKDYVCLTTLDKCQKTDWLVGHLCLPNRTCICHLFNCTMVSVTLHNS